MGCAVYRYGSLRAMQYDYVEFERERERERVGSRGSMELTWR